MPKRFSWNIMLQPVVCEKGTLSHQQRTSTKAVINAIKDQVFD